jgi:signal transduction histidine kinase
MRRISPVTWLISIVAVLIAAFVTSTFLVEHNAGKLDTAVEDIVGNASPSVTELAGARTEMRHVEMGVGRYLGAHIIGASFDRAQIAERRAALDAHLAAYGRLPFFSGERELYDQLLPVKARVYDEVDRALAAIDGGRLPEARAILFGPLYHDGEELDRLTAKLIVINSERAAARARDIAALRERTNTLAMLLDAVSVLLAGVLLFAAVRASRLYHRALIEQRRIAELRATELDHFATRVAHDLKAPLASLVLGSSVAAQYPEEATRMLKSIQRSSRLMGEMIDALLSLARVEPLREPTSVTVVAGVLDVIVDEVRPAAETAGTNLRVEPYSASATVACSAGVLASVLSNLLQNAVKFIRGAAGERAVIVRIAERGDYTRIEVEDTGPGLPPELGEHVFERHVRGKDSTGLGLGLATVKRLTESVGGRLGVTSSLGCGSCFWVELPRSLRSALRAPG